MSQWIIFRPLIGMLFSRKFLALLMAALVASGVAWASDFEQWIPLIVMVGAVMFSTLTAWEDASEKKGVLASMPGRVEPADAQEPGLDVEAGE